MKFNPVNWKSAYECLREKQALLVEVYRKKETLKVRHLQISILKDFRTIATVVRRVTTSLGSRIPGVDKVTATTVEERDALEVHSIVRTLGIYQLSGTVKKICRRQKLICLACV